LGLTISAQLVEMMDGRMWLESEPGKGSQFHFVVRFGIASESAQPIATGNLRNLRVLIVDDNATNRLILSEIVASWQMRATAVASADEALATLRKAVEEEQPFDLLLTDALMPDVDGFTLAQQVARDERTGRPKIILLTSAGAPALRGRAANLFAAKLAKPVKQSDLLDAIVTVFAAPQPARRTRAKVAPRTEPPPARALKVLVAEDNPTNQALVSALLKQKGHRVSIVGNGRLAADRAAFENFDLILMDVQMPEMGGLEATVAIRERERTAGGHVPIIALTARAMAGDREQCIEAGMDAYVSKPLRPEELFGAIDSVMAPASAAAETTRVASDILDADALLAGMGGRMDLLEHVIDVFLEDAPAMLSRIKDALQAGNATEVAAVAHALKGSVGLFSQRDAYEGAKRLEHLGRTGELAGGDALYAEVEGSLSKLTEELKRVLKRR
jgi:CheY-like chemotaxis protein